MDVYSHVGVVWIAAAHQAAVWTVGGGIVALPLVAVESLPPVRTRAGPVDGVASASVLALALVLAPQAVGPVRALLLTLHKREKVILFRNSSATRLNATHTIQKKGTHTHSRGSLGN